MLWKDPHSWNAYKSVRLFWIFRSTKGLIHTWAERGDDYHEHEK